MAERDEAVYCEKEDWTELTASDVTTVTIQNQSAFAVFLRGTVGSVKPSLEDPSGFELAAHGALHLGTETIPIASFFSGVPGITRVWAYSAVRTKVWVSHS